MPGCGNSGRYHSTRFRVASLGQPRPAPFLGEIGRLASFPSAEMASVDCNRLPETCWSPENATSGGGYVGPPWPSTRPKSETAFAVSPHQVAMVQRCLELIDWAVDVTRCRARALVGNSGSTGCLLPPRQIWASSDDGRQPDLKRRSNFRQSGEGMYPFVNPCWLPFFRVFSRHSPAGQPVQPAPFSIQASRELQPQESENPDRHGFSPIGAPLVVCASLGQQKLARRVSRLAKDSHIIPELMGMASPSFVSPAGVDFFGRFWSLKKKVARHADESMPGPPSQDLARKAHHGRFLSAHASAVRILRFPAPADRTFVRVCRGCSCFLPPKGVCCES